MNKIIYALAVLTLSFSSCQSQETSDNTNEAENTTENVDLNISKFEEMAIDPCNLISEEMVTSRFSISPEDELEKETYGSGKKLSWIAFCQYKWKKPNFDEIQKKNTEIMMATMKSGDVKNAMNKAKDIESPHFLVGVSNIKIFEDAEKALKQFELNNTVPTKEDVAKLNKELDKSLDEKGASKMEKETGEDFVDGIAAGLKFEKVPDVGTMAYWDFMSGQLNVLYGTIQIGIKMHISENHEENIAAAKEFAGAVMKQF